ncbi:sugar O-acetyltransferase [Spirosoma utsteinense]|uniref:Acetyltransferase n=1 Tax=Spirosoma utsteinense TaxID=2585773 RepID=A0ABR6W7A1_9BACT|nr:sugar O-acetyltransferase [Spirosoma utsteinense]MBC3788576.1 maltose O-acetyltransferase [Spirosoma utsteinense]MBC3791817.1 maltose O-acetyltransferase [Spirosoma utsteinense]
MTELEKMLAGDLYDASDATLVRMRTEARTLFSEFNRTPYDAEPERRKLLQQLLGHAGDNLNIQPPFYCDYGTNISIGANGFLNFNCIFLDCARITIGVNFQCAPNVQLYAAYHPVMAAERIKGPELALPITIGDNVWLGGGVIVCPGVTIGDNTTIGAGSVVTKDIPASVFAAGNPCRVIRTL